VLIEVCEFAELLVRPLLTVAQPLFRLLALGDVDVDAD
jgi:hypothetical protein